jgi:hypothetical protein
MPSIYFHKIEKDVPVKYFYGMGNNNGPVNTTKTRLYVPDGKEFTAIKQFLLKGKNKINPAVNFDPTTLPGLKVYTYKGLNGYELRSNHQTLQVEVPEDYYSLLPQLVASMVGITDGVGQVPWQKI